MTPPAAAPRPLASGLAAGSSGPAALASGSSFFLEARDTVFFDLLAAAFRAGLRAPASSSPRLLPEPAPVRIPRWARLPEVPPSAAFFETAFRLALAGAFFVPAFDDVPPAAASPAAPVASGLAAGSSGPAALGRAPPSSWKPGTRFSSTCSPQPSAPASSSPRPSPELAPAGTPRWRRLPEVASSAAAFFGTAFRRDLAGAARLDFAASFGLADCSATGDAELSGSLAVVLAADFRAGAFFAEVFRVAELAFFALAATPDALPFTVAVRVFGSGDTERSSDSFPASGTSATSAVDSGAGAWDFVRDFRAALGFFSPAVLGMAVLGVRHQFTRFKIRRIRITVRESTVWQRPLAADCGGTGTLSIRTLLASRL